VAGCRRNLRFGCQKQAGEQGHEQILGILSEEAQHVLEPVVMNRTLGWRSAASPASWST